MMSNMKLTEKVVVGSLSLSLALVFGFSVNAQAFTDVGPKTYEYQAIQSAVSDGWIVPLATATFGYGKSISPDDWLRMLMFLRTDDACPELGKSPNAYWTVQNVRMCLLGAGVPMQADGATTIRRDFAMQQLFALRRRTFAFQTMGQEPVGYVAPTDKASIPPDRLSAMIAADRLKLMFRSGGRLRPAESLLREDATLAVWRFTQWEKGGGVDQETSEVTKLHADVKLNHWKDLETDMYVLSVKAGGDAVVKPILPRRSFNPAVDPTNPSTSLRAGEKLRDEYVYQTVNELAKESGAIAAVNGSYFNVEWPWGALEDTAVVNGKTALVRPNRSTFVSCADGKFYVGSYASSSLTALKCVPQQALGAGPMFIANGKVLEQNTAEDFDEYTKWERRVGKNARTAVGVSADRKTLYIITVAGKSYPAFGKGGATLGAFLKQKYPDMAYAMMLDGGGSTALVADGKTLVAAGMASGGKERAVVSALGVFSKKADAVAAKVFEREKKLRWDLENTPLKLDKPTSTFAWVSVKDGNVNRTIGANVVLAGLRGSRLGFSYGDNESATMTLTFDRIAAGSGPNVILTRREGTHEKGWKIPTELHILDRNDGSDTDIIRLFAYMPVAQQPDLKTFDAVMFTKKGIVFGDVTGRYWYYYPKLKQLSPAIFVKQQTAKTK